MPDRHKYAPIRFRPPEPDRLWLDAYQERTGKPINAILAEALAEYRARRTASQQQDAGSTT
jgi:hypothetical protein